MKKTKLIMPLTGIAAIGAIAPVAAMTSCSNKGESIWFSKSLELIKDKVAIEPAEFKPEVESLAEGTQFDVYFRDKQMSYDMNAKYYHAVKDQPVIFADDLLYSFATQAQQVAAWGAENMTVTIINPTIMVKYKLDQMTSELVPGLYWTWTVKVDWDSSVDGKKYYETVEFKYNNIPNQWYFEGGNDESARNVLYAYIDTYQYRSLTLDDECYIDFKEHRTLPDGTVYDETLRLDSSEKMENFKERYKFNYNFFIYNMHIRPKYFENVVSTPRYYLNYQNASDPYEAGYYINNYGKFQTKRDRRCQFLAYTNNNPGINKFNLGYLDSGTWKYVEFGTVKVEVLSYNPVEMKQVEHSMSADNKTLTINETVTGDKYIVITVITSDADKEVTPRAFLQA